MSTYRTEWTCCGDFTITDSWEPARCPFCEVSRLREELAEWKAAAGVPGFTVGVLKEENERLIADRDRLAAALKEAQEQPAVAQVYIEDGKIEDVPWQGFTAYPNGMLRLYASPVPAPAVSEEWRDVINECADDLAIELDQRYGESRKYQSEQRKYEAEMQPVYRARALLQSAPQATSPGPQVKLPPGWSITRCDDNNLIVSHGEKGSVVVSRKPTDLRVIPEAVLFALADDLLGDA